VIILDAVLAEAHRCRPALIATRIQHAKFPRSLRPGMTAELQLEWRGQTLLFTVTANGEIHATGSLAFEEGSPT
jgi:3-hydroxymyristoyl/3-hydroxydecanoyl-(acyl carrier protein) dehydratase